jgi:hypothetical protein
MHSGNEGMHRVLNDAEKEQFVRDGFVKLENAFPSEIAAEARAILWHATGCDPDDRKTWTRPVVRLGDFTQDPFRQAANTTSLHAAFDELVSVGRWIPRQSVGGFPIRFPHPDDPGDTGWHVDASFPPDQPVEAPGSYFDWRINLRSKGRALLMPSVPGARCTASSWCDSAFSRAATTRCAATVRTHTERWGLFARRESNSSWTFAIGFLASNRRSTPGRWNGWSNDLRSAWFRNSN